MPKKSLIIHGCWAAFAVATFGMGSLLRSPDPIERPEQSTPSGTWRASDPLRNSSLAGKELGDGIGVSQPGAASAIMEALGGRALTSSDLETLATQAMKGTNPIARRLAFSRLLEALTPENAMTIREQLVAAGAGNNSSEWRDFNYAWGAMAGRDAFDFAAKSKERDLDAALTGWASANPSEAIALLDNLPDDLKGNRDRFAERVVAGLADSDPGMASDLVIRLAAEGNGRGENLMAMVANSALRASSPAEAALWSESIPEGPLRAAAMDRVAEAYVDEDPEAAARWAGQFAGEDYAARVIEEVSDGWAERDPVAAVTWLETLPEGRGQITGLNSVFGDWEDRDPVAASEYLSSMPDSAQRDNAISGFARGYAWQDPESAIAWAQDIQDPALRQSTLTRAGQAYFRRDRESAIAWLPTSGLPPETQQAVLEGRR